MFDTFHINADDVVVPCKNIIECSIVDHYHSADEAWKAQDIINGLATNKSTGLPMIDAMDFVEKYQSLTSSYSIDDLPKELWGEMQDVQVTLNPDENKLIFTGITLPMRLTIDFYGDCCSTSEVYEIMNESDEGFISGITIDNLEQKELNNYDVERSTLYTITFTSGEEFIFKEVNVSNGFYTTAMNFNLTLTK